MADRHKAKQIEKWLNPSKKEIKRRERDHKKSISDDDLYRDEPNLEDGIK